MEHMRQCPQCGKYVAADRTYCMNCGVTLGIRCMNCRGVMPVGSKTCTACGHSFVKKKKKIDIPLWKWMKKNITGTARTPAGLPRNIILKH